MMQHWKHFLQAFAVFAAIYCGTVDAGAAKEINERKSHDLYLKGKAEYENKHYEAARKYYDEALDCTAAPTDGLRIAIAILDINTGNFIAARKSLERLLEDALRDQKAVRDEYDKAAETFAGKNPKERQRLLEPYELKKNNQEKWVIDIRYNLEIANSRIAKIVIKVPANAATQWPSLQLWIDGQAIAPDDWKNAKVMEVDAGRHTIEATIPSGKPQTRDTIVGVENITANAQRPVDVEIKLDTPPPTGPVRGATRLKKYLQRVASERWSFYDQHPKDPHAICYRTAWEPLSNLEIEVDNKLLHADLSMVDQSLRDNEDLSGKIEDDHPEVVKIWGRIAYEIEPCFQDCINDRPVCNIDKDKNGRVWSGGCHKCTFGGPESPSSDRTAIATSAFVLSVALLRTRRKAKPTSA